MRRLLATLLAPMLLLLPGVARAHDPLDDVSGEEDLNNPSRDTEKPKSHKKERQEQELAKEVQEHEETEFHVTSEKEEFLRDRSDTKEVKAGQVRRSQLSGGAARPRRAQPESPRSQPAAPATTASPKDPAAAPAEERGDVDPTDSSMDTSAKPQVDGNGEAEPAPAPPAKKKHKR